MGAWDYGLLDNDDAASAIGDVMSRILQLAAQSANSTMSRQSAGAFAAQLGLLVHYQPWLFEADQDDEGYAAVQAIRSGVKQNRSVLDQVAPKAHALLDQVVSGKPLQENPPFEALLQAIHARAFLQELADEAIEEAEDTFDESSSGAPLDMLRVLSPNVELPARRMRQWLRRFREAFAKADENDRAYLRSYVDACKKLVSAAKQLDDDDNDDDEDNDE